MSHSKPEDEAKPEGTFRSQDSSQPNEDVPRQQGIQAGTPLQPRHAPPPARPADPYEDDERESPRRRRYREREDEGYSGLIPYKNGLALAAYYCGVIGLIPCLGAVLGFVALVLGIFGLRHVRLHPEAKGTGHAITGIVLGALEILGHLAVFLLMVVFSRR